MIGKVKWWNSLKGYGFIVPSDGGKDVFAHFSNVIDYGKGKEPKEGESVEFEVVHGQRGPAAEKVMRAR